MTFEKFSELCRIEFERAEQQFGSESVTVGRSNGMSDEVHDYVNSDAFLTTARVGAAGRIREIMG